ncbi:hypothetical protein ATO2_03165 [Roseovarius sp. 22II1-1F6A]|nr:hypothetical protein ATO2_03165 [Roseovarius sp. 22II1-1F6A]
MEGGDVGQWRTDMHRNREHGQCREMARRCQGGRDVSSQGGEVKRGAGEGAGAEGDEGLRGGVGRWPVRHRQGRARISELGAPAREQG